MPFFMFPPFLCVFFFFGAGFLFKFIPSKNNQKIAQFAALSLVLFYANDCQLLSACYGALAVVMCFCVKQWLTRHWKIHQMWVFSIPVDPKFEPFFSSSGWQRLQVCLHHFLPRWSIEDTREEDLRGIQSYFISMPWGTSRSSWNGYGCHDKNWGFKHRLGTNSSKVFK